MAKLDDDEPTLFLEKCDAEGSRTSTLSEKQLMLSQMTKLKVESNLWYLDNGASSHMIGFKLYFTKLDEKVTIFMSFRDSSNVRIEGKGSVFFVCKNGETRTIEDVYYIPTLRINIMSL